MVYYVFISRNGGGGRMKRSAFNRKFYGDLYDFGEFEDLGYFVDYVDDEDHITLDATDVAG